MIALGGTPNHSRHPYVMPILNVRLTPDQAHFIDRHAHGYVKKSDVVRGLIDQAMLMHGQPTNQPLAQAAPGVSILGKGGRGEGAYSPLTNNPLGLEQPLRLLETAHRNPLYPLTERTTCGIKGVQGEKDQTPPERVPDHIPAAVDNASNPTAAQPPNPSFVRFNATAQDVPEHLTEATESILDFWASKSGRATHRAWQSLISNCSKILADKRGNMEILCGELDSATQGGFRGLNYERWLAYGVKTDSGTFQRRTGASEPDMSNHPAYKPFPGFGD